MTVNELTRPSSTWWRKQQDEARRLDAEIEANLEILGFTAKRKYEGPDD